MFDAHGAGAGQNTSAVSINDAGTVVGVYRHKSFSRSANGGASAAGIDNAEAIVGSYLDASDVSYGFLLQKLNALVPNPTRIEGGKRKCRDLPCTEWSFFRSAVFAPRRRPRRSRKTLTAPSSRSTLRGPAAAGFVRAADGTITGFGTPFGSVIVDTIATSINAAGAVTGYCTDSMQTSHGFVRRASGDIVSFDPAGAVGTTARSINAAGPVTGYYFDASD